MIENMYLTLLIYLAINAIRCRNALFNYNSNVIKIFISIHINILGFSNYFNYLILT